jgi:methylenetetrahydrofolate dehydrogenase (NADP+) / methenyltetrahydrofolate cyclohydrolase
MILLDGKKLATEIKTELAQAVSSLQAEGGKIPHLAAILVGNDGASETYVASKVKSCAEVGFESTLIRFESSISEAELLAKIEELNQNKSIDGFIVQLPLPKHISEEKVVQAISPSKDVDGFHPINIGRMAKGLPAYISATPYGILQMLERYEIATAGKHCVVIGRSQIVGSPMSILLARKAKIGNCTVTLCHSQTKNISDFTRQADIIVVAMGVPEFLKGDMVSEGAIVIDVGMTRVPDASKKSGFKLKGDVDFEAVAPKCAYITPVPGGVGLMTVCSLLQNTLLAAQGKIYGS